LYINQTHLNSSHKQGFSALDGFYFFENQPLPLLCSLHRKLIFNSENEMSTQHFNLNIELSFRQLLELVKQLPSGEKQLLREVLEAEDVLNDLSIPEAHKQIVRERIIQYQNSPEAYLSWDDIEKKMSEPE
jgi:hypothetical protein